MPLDHYVSQVHLRNFYAPELGELMYAIRKQDQYHFTPNAKSVCRIEEGSTNPYLQDERIIEEFLKGIEPKYNSSVTNVLSDKIDQECVYTLAGFVSYVLSCSPAAMRIHGDFLKNMVEDHSHRLELLGKIAPPPELGGESLSHLISEGIVSAKIDEKYPQALGIASILSRSATYGNSAWEILINPFEDSSFFTSDYPVAIEQSSDPRVLNRITPLTPQLAIRIQPDIYADEENYDFNFSNFRYKRKLLDRKEVRKLNQLFVRCAETTVFFNKRKPWVSRFVERNSSFRIEPETRKFPLDGKTLLWSTHVIAHVSP